MDGYDWDGTSDLEDDDPALQSMELESFSEPQGKDGHALNEERQAHLEELLASRQIIPPKGYRSPTWKINDDTMQFRFPPEGDDGQKALHFQTSYSWICEYLEEKLEPLKLYHRKGSNRAYVRAVPPETLGNLFKRLENYCYGPDDGKSARNVQRLPSADLCAEFDKLIVEDVFASHRSHHPMGWPAFVVKQWNKDFKGLRVCERLTELLNGIERYCQCPYVKSSPYTARKIAYDNWRCALIYQGKYDAEGFELQQGERVEGGKKLEDELCEEFRDVEILERLSRGEEPRLEQTNKKDQQPGDPPYDWEFFRAYALSAAIFSNYQHETRACYELTKDWKSRRASNRPENMIQCRPAKVCGRRS